MTAKIHLAGELKEEEITRLLPSARGCKIHNTLRSVPHIDVSIQME